MASSRPSCLLRFAVPAPALINEDSNCHTDFIYGA
jgi:hypothetical protein